MTVTVVMALAFTVSDVSAAQKAYPAQKKSNLYRVYAGSEVKNGTITVVNAEKFYIYSQKDNDIVYYEKANGTDIKKVKTPTKKSKKTETKTFTITKDTTFKFKVVKKNATAAQVKKAKTYYVIIKVKNVNPFKNTTESITLDKGQSFQVNIQSLNKNAYDRIIYSSDEDKTIYGTCTNANKKFKITVTKNCTIKVNAYKLNKKVGTKTYNVTLKTYTKPSDYKFYTVESNWVLEGTQKIAYFDDGSGHYLTQSGIEVPDGFKLVTKYNGKSGYNYKLNTTNTFYYELYRARYYKVNGEYEFASWELVEKKTLTYKVWDNTFKAGYNGFYGFVAPVNGYVKNSNSYVGAWAYYMKDGDETVYRTFLKPGEALDPEYQWIAMELKLNGERAWTPAQVKYNFDGLYNRFCSYNAFMEAYNGLHDEVNTYGRPAPTLAPTSSPVSPETPQ